jgi:hypothetical protein
MSQYVTGLDEVRANLARIVRDTTPRATTAACRAGMTPVARALRAAVNAANMSPELKRAARATINSRVAGAGKEKIAKVGFGVGKQSKAKRAKAKARAAAGGGVGVSSRNIHWFLGTAERKTRTGRRAGRIPPLLIGLTGQALAAAGAQAIAAARAKVIEIFHREIRSK